MIVLQLLLPLLLARVLCGAPSDDKKSFDSSQSYTTNDIGHTVSGLTSAMERETPVSGKVLP